MASLVFLLSLLFWLDSSLSRPSLVPEECLQGPAFWCQDLDSASACGKDQYCQRLVWNPPSQVEAPAIKCGICTSILRKLQSLIGDDVNEETIDNAEDILCSAIGRRLKGLCRKMLKKFRAKINQALLDEKDAKEICILVKMCRGTTESMSHLEDTCDLCLTFTRLAESELRSICPGRDLGDILNNTCRQHFRSSPKCKVFVTTYGAKMRQVPMLTQDPVATCLDVKACQLEEETPTWDMAAEGEPSSGMATWDELGDGRPGSPA